MTDSSFATSERDSPSLHMKKLLTSGEGPGDCSADCGHAGEAEDGGGRRWGASPSRPASAGRDTAARLSDSGVAGTRS
eukprot:9483864-Pyramimonas_sp.AAC.1